MLCLISQNLKSIFMICFTTKERKDMFFLRLVYEKSFTLDFWGTVKK